MKPTIFFASIFILLLAGHGFPQNNSLSRWAIGRPSMLIDLPGQPSAGGVKWAESNTYWFTPNS